VLTKCLGTTNPINMVRAAEQGLRALRRPEDIAMQRGKTLVEVVGERAARRPKPPRWRQQPPLHSRRPRGKRSLKLWRG